MGKTKISWATDAVNVVHGCSKPAAIPPDAIEFLPPGFQVDPKWTKPGTSPECVRCYAEELSLRRGWTKQPWQDENSEGNVMLKPAKLKELRNLTRCEQFAAPSNRTRVFICSMGDIFHDQVPDDYLHQLWEVMLSRPDCIHMLLTKRAARASRWPGPWPEHIWLGVTHGHPVTAWRAEALRRSQAKVRFISAEPLLGSLADTNLDGIHQVIAGGESGKGFRKMNMSWARELRDRCEADGRAFFYKQDSAFRTETRPFIRNVDGSCYEYHQYPGELRAPINIYGPGGISVDEPTEMFPIIQG